MTPLTPGRDGEGPLPGEAAPSQLCRVVPGCPLPARQRMALTAVCHPSPAAALASAGETSLHCWTLRGAGAALCTADTADSCTELSQGAEEEETAAIEELPAASEGPVLAEVAGVDLEAQADELASSFHAAEAGMAVDQVRLACWERAEGSPLCG